MSKTKKIERSNEVNINDECMLIEMGSFLIYNDFIKRYSLCHNNMIYSLGT